MLKIVPILFLLLLFSLASFAQTPHPGKPVFMVTYEESGKNAIGSWQISAIQKFSLSNWNEPLRGKGLTAEERKLPLDLEPDAILKLQVGDKITFYPSEANDYGSGEGGSFKRVLTTDGVDVVTVTDSRGVQTVVETDADYRLNHNVPSNENFRQNARYYGLGELAELVRTSDGAILYANVSAMADPLDGWGVSDETDNQVFPEVEKFILTNKDLQSWQQITRTNVRSGSYEDESLTVKVTVTMSIEDVEEAEVTLYGCSELGVGQMKQVIASAKPEGGQFRFWAEPQGMLTVEPDASSATINGTTPGRGTLYVEYTSPEGKTAQSSQPATCLKIDSYNGGETLPQIPLFDIDGKELPAVLKVPIAAEPSRIEELVDFVLSDNTIVNVYVQDNYVELHGQKQGEITLQAKTSCGSSVGPAVDVEVVNCDDETIAKLEEMMKIAKENQKKAYQEIERILGSKGFEEAARDIKKSTYELAEKTILLIVGTSGVKGIETAAGIIEAGVGLKDIIMSDNLMELTSNELQVVVSQFGKETAQTLAGTIEVITAANKFGNDLGKLISTDIELKNAMKWAEQSNKQIEDIVRRQRICRRDTQQLPGKETPKTEPAPHPAEPTAKTETPPAKEPATASKKPPAQEPPADEPPAGEPPISPPPPTSEPRQVGLPYMPANCGCNKSQGISASQEGFSALQTGMENLGKCVDNFSKGPLTGYIKTLEQWKVVCDDLNNAIKTGPAELKKVSEKAAPQIELLIGKTKTFDEAGKIFNDEFDGCKKSVETGIEVMNSAKNIPEISVSGNK